MFPPEMTLLYFASLALVSYVGIRFVEFAEHTEDLGYERIMCWVRKSKTQSEECTCMGYRIKKTCRHFNS
jgi:hypothetical protein